MTIKTHYVFPPIPIRSFDWSAMDADSDKVYAIGWGATEEEAVADLAAQLEDEIP